VQLMEQSKSKAVQDSRMPMSNIQTISGKRYAI
jgi:hypothetical protein